MLPRASDDERPESVMQGERGPRMMNPKGREEGGEGGKECKGNVASVLKEGWREKDGERRFERGLALL